MKAGRFAISHELLTHLLALPEGTRIRGMMNDVEFPHSVGIVIEHPDLPEVKEDSMPPKLEVKYKYSAEKGIEFDSWSIRD